MMTPENHIDILTDLLYNKKKESEITQAINQNIKNHERCIEILEGIKAFERRIERDIESLNGYPGTFLSLQKKFIKDIEIRKKCVARLINSYYKLLNEIDN